MIYSIPKDAILKLLELQLSNWFLLDTPEKKVLEKYLDDVLLRCEVCFSENENKYYHKENNTFFNPYHSVQYMTFLYFFANTIYKYEKAEQAVLCDKIYYLNKIMNGVDLFYAIDLPDFFSAEHPVGSVLGRAQYGNGFMFYQNCSVGGVHLPQNKIVYPILGDHVKMFAGSMILGNCKIGDNVNIGAGALIKNQDIPAGVNVFGISPNLIIKNKKNGF